MLYEVITVCAPRLTQLAIRYGTEHLDDWIVAKRRMMQRRHDAFRAAFERPDNPFVLAASGGFFASYNFV